jgi:ornithine cyclodeaminase
LLVLSAADVHRALPMANAIELMRAAFVQVSSGEANVPPRLHFDAAAGTLLVMPALLPRSGDFCVKVVSVYPENPRRGLPVLNGLVMEFDVDTGLPRAVINGQALTAIRTGAAGGLAADLFARKDARSAVLFGAGLQGRYQLLGLLAVRRITRVYLVDNHRAAVENLAAKIALWPDAPEVQIANDPGEAVRRADVVLAATNCSTPVFDGRDLQPGTHVTAVGSYKPTTREVDEVTVRRARVIVDAREAALAEAGDLAGCDPADVIEIGEVVAGKAPARQNDQEITFFKSVGIAAQDAAAARYTTDQAERLGLGTIMRL